MSEAKVAGTAPVVLQLDMGTYYWCACGRSATQPKKVPKKVPGTP